MSGPCCVVLAFGGAAWQDVGVQVACAVLSAAGFGRAARGRAACAVLLLAGVSGAAGAGGRRVERVAVVPSVRGGEVAVQVVLGGEGNAGQLAVVAEFWEGAGGAARRFEKAVKDPGGDGAAVRCAWKWEKPPLWEIGAPKVLRMSVTITGGGLSEKRGGPFGFRELWIEGRELRFNGTRVHFRPAPAPAAADAAAAEAALRRLGGTGFNAVICDPALGAEDGGGATNVAAVCEAASRAGMVVVAPLRGFREALDGWGEKKAREEWRQSVARQVNELGAWPSVVMWGVDGEGLGHGGDVHPARMGVKGWPVSERWRERARAGEEALAVVRSIDASRPVMVHDGGPVGEVYAPRVHLGWVPQQEREEWPLRWSEAGDMPLCAVELGGPAVEDFCLVSGPGGGPEPFLTEHAAAELGVAAYGRETGEYRAALAAGRGAWRPGLLYGEALFQEVETRLIRGVWRSWRGWGVPGGMVPRIGVPGFDLEPEGGALSAWLTPLLEEVNGPVLAWLAGPPEEFTSRSRHFFSGARVVKSVALANDKRAEAAYSLRWRAEVGGEQVGVGQSAGHLAAGQVRFFPVEFTAPAVNRRVEGTVRFDADVGGVLFEESFPVWVYPAPGQKAWAGARAVHVFDPEGETTRALRLLGVKVQAWDGRGDPGRVLVVGRNALCGGLAAPGSFEQFAAGGGRVLLCAQEPDWVEARTPFRLSPRNERRFWPVGQTEGAVHPLLKGMDADDFRDWSGGRGPASVVADQDSGSRVTMGPMHAWRWSDRGVVAVAPPEKPHFGGWRPILEGGFDLAYAPLMELEHGRGLILWSSLDIEERVEVEPVAREILERMLAYLDAFRPGPERGPTYYTGGAAWQRRFDAMGLDFQPVQAMPRVPGLLIVAPESPIVDRLLEEHLDRGGSVLLLPREAGRLPLGFEARAGKPFSRVEALPAWPELRGISLAEVRARCDIAAAMLAGGPGEIAGGGMFGRLARAGGTVLSVQVGPEEIRRSGAACTALSACRNQRMLSQVLANMGATFTRDRKAFEPGADDARPVALAGGWLARAEGGASGRAAPGSFGERAGWADPGVGANGWVPVEMPGAWQDAHPALAGAQGAVWLRREVTVPKTWVGRRLRVRLGRVADEGVVYFNGRRLEAAEGTRAVEAVVPADLVAGVLNVVVVRVWSESGPGGLVSRDGRGMCVENTEVAGTGDYYQTGPEGEVMLGERWLRMRRWGRERWMQWLPDMDSNHD